MKKLFVFVVMFILGLSLALAASVSREMSARVEPNSEVNVKLTLNGATAGEAVAIEDTLPNSISIKSWDISGSQESKSDVNYVKKESQKAGFDRHSWAFTAATSSPSITYMFDAPNSLGNYEFDVRWVTKDGFSHQASSLTVRKITCGDNVCEGNENSDNCVADCPKPAVKQEATPTPQPKPVETPKKAPVAWIVVGLIVVAGIIGYVIYQKKKSRD